MGASEESCPSCGCVNPKLMPKLEPLWNYVTEQTKSKISMPALWRAMEAATPVALVRDELILGYEPGELHQSGLVLDHRHKNVIEQTIEAASRRRLKLRAIAGKTMQDLQMELQTELEGARLQQQTREQFLKTAEAGQTWEAVGEQLIRRFAAIPNRGLTSVQGRFLSEAVPAIAEAYARLMPAQPTEHDERSYTRVLERLAERTNVTAPILGFLVEERRKKGS